MTLGLLVTAFTLGLRHGVDWDHVAAIADLTSSAPSRRRGFFLSLWYALGHAVVVCVLGLAALWFSASIPEGLDRWMGRVVGATLLALGTWVTVDLLRRGREVRLRSRWMLVLDGTFAGLHRIRRRGRSRSVSIVHDHDHIHDGDHLHAAPPAHDHAHIPADQEVAAVEVGVLATPSSAPERGGVRWPWTGRGRPHRHPHRHELALPDGPATGSGGLVAAGIGVLHGIGIESPTQIAIFVASTSLVGQMGGALLLVAWVVGLVAANAGLALVAGRGLLSARRNTRVRVALAATVAVSSIAMGVVYLFDLAHLPGILS